MPIIDYPDEMMATGSLDLRPTQQDGPDPSAMQVLGAAFRQDNTVGSAMADKTSGVDPTERDGLTGDQRPRR